MNLHLLNYPKLLVSITALSLSFSFCPAQKNNTTITEWQYGKNGAVSITYDDASRNQFTRALPVMERLKLPATFFVITGPITGSTYQGKFVGRPVEVIIKESATIPTDENNFLERCSAAGYLGYMGTISYHTHAGGLYSSGKKQQAYHLMDSLSMLKCAMEILNRAMNHVLSTKKLWDPAGMISEKMQAKVMRSRVIPSHMLRCPVWMKPISNMNSRRVRKK